MSREPIVEQGIIAGNVYDKYQTRNPIARRLMEGFHHAIESLVLESGASTIHEIGCGEGHLAAELNRLPGVLSVRGSDFSSQVIELAKRLHGDEGISFKTASIYELTPEADAAELVVCCEVLEHLERPGDALAVLHGLANPYCLLSVPREPIWRMLNMARGKYLAEMGNTPGHIQHWSKARFIRLVSDQFEIKEIRTPLPWTVLLCRRS